MAELAKTLLLCGLLSGTQPVTMMGLLLVMGGATPRKNGYAFVAGAFMVQTVLLLGASLVFGASVDESSGPGRSFVGIRLIVGIAAVVIGVLLRRPPGKPIPEIPNALARLQQMGPKQSFVAGIIVADYQGPVLASLALASTEVASGGRLSALVFYAALASGIPFGILIWATRSDSAMNKLDRGTRWIMRNRRHLASWILMVVGAAVALDAALTLAL